MAAAARILKNQQGQQASGGGQSSGDTMLGRLVNQCASTELMLARPGSDDSKVCVRIGVLKSCVDSLSRAASSAEHARRLCTSAAQVFADECIVLKECRDNLASHVP